MQSVLFDDNDDDPIAAILDVWGAEQHAAWGTSCLRSVMVWGRPYEDDSWPQRFAELRAARELLDAAGMYAALVVGLVILPPVLIAVLHRTRMYWLAGVGLLGFALYLLGGVTPAHNDESDPGLSAIGNAIVVGGGILVAIYGFSALAFARGLYERHRNRVATLPPTATAVAGVTER